MKKKLKPGDYVRLKKNSRCKTIAKITSIQANGIAKLCRELDNCICWPVDELEQVADLAKVTLSEYDQDDAEKILKEELEKLVDVGLMKYIGKDADRVLWDISGDYQARTVNGTRYGVTTVYVNICLRDQVPEFKLWMTAGEGFLHIKLVNEDDNHLDDIYFHDITPGQIHGRIVAVILGELKTWIRQCRERAEAQARSCQTFMDKLNPLKIKEWRKNAR